MYDLLIKGGTIVDGTGAAARQADVAITGSRIAAVGRIDGDARQVIDATNRIVAPGWVDIHTHYDAQVTWDSELAPSSWHGVTTVVAGNCGVGFAPVRPSQREWIIGLMEGVEDIPGSALSEGIEWDWETFPQYLDALDAKRWTVDVGSQIAHGPLRTYVMGERGARNEPATDQDVAQMKQLVAEALAAGAVGASTSRTISHRAIDGEPVPGTFAAEKELRAIAEAVGEAGHGALELAPAGIVGEDLVAPMKELDWMRRLSKETGCPITFIAVQNNIAPDAWKELLSETDKAIADGAKIIPQVIVRATNILFTLSSTNHPFYNYPSFVPLRELPVDERIARLRDPGLRAALLGEADPVDTSQARFYSDPWETTFALGEECEYEPLPENSVAAMARALGKTPREHGYDLMMEKNGRQVLLFAVANYAYGDLEPTRAMLAHPYTVPGGSDAGAHCRVICDASLPTFLLTHWVRDRTRGERFPIEWMVRKQTMDTAKLFGFTDRGVIAPGYKADINVIDLDHLKLGLPYLIADLPTGAERYVQEAVGYDATILSGRIVRRHGKDTGERPGRLLRGKREQPLQPA